MNEPAGDTITQFHPDPVVLRAAENWETARAALCARIRRRWTALARLSPDIADAESIELHLRTIGDDAAELFKLADQIDRRLDLAFAGRARRPDTSGPATRAKPAHDAFKTS